MKKRCVLLDMGGVILRVGNTEGLPGGPLDFRGREAMLALLAKAGARACLEDLDALVFQPWRVEHAHRYDRVKDARWEPHLERFCRAAGVDIDRWELLDAWFRPFADQLEPEPGAAETLRVLSDMGPRLALVSNVPLPGRFYERVLRRFDLAEPFHALCFSYDEHTRKPSPALLRNALGHVDVMPENALMVGDRRAADIAAGRAAGIETVWIRSAFDEGPEPDHEIDSIRELPQLLEAIESR